MEHITVVGLVILEVNSQEVLRTMLWLRWKLYPRSLLQMRRPYRVCLDCNAQLIKSAHDWWLTSALLSTYLLQQKRLKHRAFLLQCTSQSAGCSRDYAQSSQPDAKWTVAAFTATASTAWWILRRRTRKEQPEEPPSNLVAKQCLVEGAELSSLKEAFWNALNKRFSESFTASFWLLFSSGCICALA